MTTLCRHVALPSAARRVVDGPVAGGTFWALAHANDLPRGPLAYADARFLLATGTLWIADHRVSTGWTQVQDAAALRGFAAHADFNGAVCFAPYLAQLYWVPANSRGRRFLGRAITRAHSRAN